MRLVVPSSMGLVVPSPIRSVVPCREHVTVRLTPDGKEVTGVYYSAHRSAFHVSLSQK